MKKWKLTAAGILMCATIVETSSGKEVSVKEGYNWDITGEEDERTIVNVLEGKTGATTNVQYRKKNNESTIILKATTELRDEPYSTTIFSDYTIENLTIESDEKRIASHKEYNNLVVNTSVKRLNNGNDSKITINKNHEVGVIKNSAEKWLKVINHGNIDNIINAYQITNDGVLNGFENTDDVENKQGGVITPKTTSNTKSLLNSGIIKLGTRDLVVDGKHGESFANDISGEVHTTDTGRLVLYGAGETLTSNWGNITSDNDDLGYGPIVLGTSKNNPGNIVLHNIGTITGTKNAVTIDGTETGEGTVATIVNQGNINGGIATTAITGDKSTVTFVNLYSGVWSGDFQDKEYQERATSNQFVKITNEGTIKTTRNEKNERGIIHSNMTINEGTIDIRDGSLTLDGDYEGRPGGQIHTSGVLGGDETELPNLQITGKVAGDATLVTIDNLGGTGAATQEGIAVVRAKSVDGEGFTKKGRIVAGAYDYDLVRIESGDYTEWRLTSEATPVPPGPTPPVPPGPTPPVPPGPTPPVPPGPTPPVPPGPTPPVPPKPVHQMRPEAGTYAENLRQANTLFITDSEQRRAVGKYTNPDTGRTETSSLWLSQTGGHSARHDASGQLKSDYNRYTVQLGGTVLSLPAGDDGRLEAGVQAGYGHARGNTRSGLTGYQGSGTVFGYSTGLYVTWYRDGQSGAYVSTTLQYSRLKNQVKGDDLAAEKYDARGTTLSLEGGYDYAVWQGGEQNGDSLFIRPHAQVTRMGVKADEHREANGTRVRQEGDGSVFSRTGVRVWLDKAVSKEQRVQPFVETNWLHNTRDFCSSMDGVRDCLAGNRNQAEVLAGVRGDVSPDVAVTAQAGGRFGSQASRDLAGTLNVSVKF
ncbi:autotransporter outer membrane beta-barrel domain-containing protein [Salmonella enterica]|nr:autotransporter outer membrane beta-barrel domain-containing protein [Salmonella enterica]